MLCSQPQRSSKIHRLPDSSSLTPPPALQVNSSEHWGCTPGLGGQGVGLQVCTGTWGIIPALEEQKPASRMKPFPRQPGTAGLRGNAGRSAVLVQAQSIVLNVPSTWRGSKQGPGCTCVCAAQGSQGLARSGLATQSGGLTSRSSKMWAACDQEKLHRPV